MKKRARPKPEITVEEIVAIRESLGLTQAQAGELLGGGPSAYAKYEAGTVRPAAAAVNLLRLLNAHPGMLDTLPGAESPAVPVRASALSPFEVSSKDIGGLPRDDLPELLRRLLAAEAEAHELPADGIHVADNTDAPDGGEDGRITWESGPERTPFLPSRRCQFQLKSGRVQPARAGREMLDKDGAVKSMIREFLEDGGHYLMLCTHPYAWKAIKERKERIRDALGEADLKVARDRIQFRDAGQIATWTNCHPAVALWVREKTGARIPGPFRSWSHWAGRTEHAAPWSEDERLPKFRAQLLEQMAQPRGIARIVGPYGIGKSRLTLQALGPDSANWSLSHLVLYADEAEASPDAISEVIQRLADSITRAIVVVNHCAPERHRMLENMALRESSRLSLITIDEEATGTAAEAVLIEVRKPAATVVETIIDRTSPGLLPEDRRRLVRFAADNPGTAVRVARAWREATPLAEATDNDLIDAAVRGRSHLGPELLRKAAALLAAFGLVAPGAKDERELSAVAKLGRSLTGDGLYAAMADLANRDVVHQRGDLMLFPASPVSMRLTERQWREWSPAKWDKILGGGIGSALSLRAARRLSLLNDTEIARKVAAHVCRAGGPLDGMLERSPSGRTEILVPLAETNAEAVVEFLDRTLNEIEDWSKIRETLKIGWALSKIAFRADTFADGAQLLLKLAAGDGPGMNGIARRRFTNLFPVCEGSTAATGKARLKFLDGALGNHLPEERPILVDALFRGMQTRHFTRYVGDESHGAHPALEPWLPDTHQEAREYLSGCMERLVPFAGRDDETGRDARAQFGQRLCDLLGYGLISAVEEAVDRVRGVAGGWPEAIESLELFLQRDAREEDRNLIGRVRELIKQLRPRELEERGRFLVTHMPWDHPAGRELTHEERRKAQVQEVEELAAEFIKQPERIKRLLPEISRGQQRMAFEFGQALAGDADAPPDWLEPIAATTASAPDEERNFGLLCGYLASIHAKHPTTVREFKRQAARSAKLAPALPLICRSCGIEPADIRLVLDALEAGRLHPWYLRQWEYFRGLAEIPAAAAAPLFDRLLDGNAEAFRAGVFLLEAYAREKPKSLTNLGPQIHRMAENAIHHGADTDTRMLADRFGRVMEKALEGGWQDPGARATALALAKALARIGSWDGGRLVKPVLPRLLADFTEIVWPVLGQAIAADPNRGKRLKYALGDPHSFEKVKRPPILSLPIEALFGWCHEHPDRAPAFTASTVPVLTTYGTEASDRKLHPVLSRLLNEFGERQDVLDGVGGNIREYSWSGPPAEYYELFVEPLEALRAGHPKKPVRRWAKEMLRWLRERAKSSRAEDEEREAHWEV